MSNLKGNKEMKNLVFILIISCLGYLWLYLELNEREDALVAQQELKKQHENVVVLPFFNKTIIIQ